MHNCNKSMKSQQIDMGDWWCYSCKIQTANEGNLGTFCHYILSCSDHCKVTAISMQSHCKAQLQFEPWRATSKINQNILQWSLKTCGRLFGGAHHQLLLHLSQITIINCCCNCHRYPSTVVATVTNTHHQLLLSLSQIPIINCCYSCHKYLPSTVDHIYFSKLNLRSKYLN